MSALTVTFDPRRITQSGPFPKTFEYAGRSFHLLEDVFAPPDFPSTFIFTDLLNLRPGGPFLEVGCGSGVTSVMAAIMGRSSVTAVDINPAAVRNTTINIALHGVGHVASVLEGDLFAPLASTARFETIYWNSNFVHVACDAVLSHYEMAFFDPGYAGHDRFLRDARRHLAPGGSIMLGFSNLGDRGLLEDIAARYGWTIEPSGSAISEEEGSPRYDLLQLKNA